MNDYIEHLADLIDPSSNRIYNMTVPAARDRVLSGSPQAVREIDGSFALIARAGKMVRMARSLDRPMRYFLAKRAEGPALIVAERIDAIYAWLKSEGFENQFHPSYTRMVPAHYVIEIQLIGCPDPDPTYTRFFDPPRNAFPTDLEQIGRAYIGALADEISKWLREIPEREPIGVCFSGGIDSGAVFLTTYHVMRKHGMNLSRLKAFTLCNPSNPCGRVFTRAELLQIAALAEEFDVWVLTDEVYEHIVFAPHRHTYFATLPGMAQRTLMCSSLSKTFSITGWRLGYVHAVPEVIAQARKVHDFLTVGAAAPLQHAVVTALNFPASYYDELAAKYAESRDVLLSYLDRTGLSYTRPEGAYFVMVDISPFGYASDVEFSQWMAKEIGVAPVPGSSFFANGENRYVRLNFAKKPATLHAAGERLLKLKR